MRRFLTRNFTVGVMDGGFFFLGLSFASVVTVLPLFVSQLTSSPYLIGLIPAIQTMGWLLPQLLTAPLVERLPRKKPFVMLMTLNERWPFIGMALVAYFVPQLGASLALTLFFTLHILRCFGAGLTATAWQDMVGKVIPANRRGLFFGLQSGVGGLLGAGGAILAGLILQQQPFALNFAICFAITALCVAFSMLFLALTHEPTQAVNPSRVTGRDFWRRLPRILGQNRAFRNFIVYRILYIFGTTGYGFYTVYAVKEFGLNSAQAGELTFAMMAAQTLTYPLVGWLGDRLGHHRVMELAAASGAFMAALSAFAPNGGWFVGVYILLGISLAAATISNLSGVYDFAPPEERATYIGLMATLVGIGSTLAPLLGGAVASTTSYPMLFRLTIVFALAAWATVRWGISDPRHAPAAPLPEGAES
ncbi:MAG: MFS transporter [Anaerolineae bacterium]|nr:MFS transporter [Anaerolineae bacterium]